METLSESIYGEEEGSELDELSETVHMVLFLVMVLFLAQAIGLVALGNSIQKQWRLWETSSINKLPRSIVGYVEDISRRPFAVNLFTHRLPVPYRILVYKATAHGALAPNTNRGLKPCKRRIHWFSRLVHPGRP